MVHQPKVLPPIMEHAEGSHPRHQLELRGLTPPWVVDRVTVLLAASGPLSVHTEAHPLTHTLNWTHADRPQAPPAPTGDGVAARQGGCWDAIEQARWQGGAVSVKDGGWHRPRVGCRFARSVTVEGEGRFVTTLASRGLDSG
ncbi:hypothetical protein QBZ16_001310 [Prototheca wickerhamii]|uniref:Uncharacterized protein n=1 Tax=Prototheca wickerhamii TaxID=3111 RepID=A0AAD9MG33_PROWI|nr:hypothetical protein QBZ16_001310 [Prototheca wickerhamii]